MQYEAEAGPLACWGTGMVFVGLDGSRASAVLWVRAWGRAAGLPAAALHSPECSKGPALDHVPAVFQLSPIYGIYAGIL